MGCVHPFGELANYVLHVLFVASMHALPGTIPVCVFKSCPDSRMLEDARHVPSDLAVNSLLESLNSQEVDNPECVTSL